MGINFKLNCEIGVDISFDVIMNDYDAIFLGTGTYTSLQGGFKGENLLEFIKQLII